MIREVKSAHINLFTILLTAFKCFKSPLDGNVGYEPDTSRAQNLASEVHAVFGSKLWMPCLELFAYLPSEELETM